MAIAFRQLRATKVFFLFAAILLALSFSGCATPSSPPDDEAERKIFALSETAHVHEQKRQYREAVRLYEEAIAIKPQPLDLAQSKARRWVQNNLAWLLATCPDGGIRNGGRALRLAEELVAGKLKHAGYFDTLAAAYAETGQFDKALKAEKQALSLLPTAHPLRNEFIRHLAAYKDRKPWRKP